MSQLFDISHANSEQLIKTDEDRQFLKLQQQSRTGSIGPVDNKLMVKEKRVANIKNNLSGISIMQQKMLYQKLFTWTEWVIINSRVSCRPTTGQCNTFNNIIRLPAADAVHEYKILASVNQWLLACALTRQLPILDKLNGACTLLEKAMGRNLLWMACRHHMFEVLLADVFNVCLGPSTGPEILFFKRFREKWTEMNHTSEARSTPLIIFSDAIKAFIKCQLEGQTFTR